MNYYDTFIEVAENCPVDAAEIPELEGNNKTSAVMQYEMIANNPYKYTERMCFSRYWRRE